MKTIYFVRHGESVANAAGFLAGSRNDAPLTQKGRQQALETAALVARVPVEIVVVSPLSRAQETAQIIVNAIGYNGKVQTEPLFTERDFGDATGMLRSEAREALDSGKVKGVEQLADLHIRACGALEYLRELPHQYILVVSHNSFGRMLAVAADGLGPEGFLLRPTFSNAALYTFSLE